MAISLSLTDVGISCPSREFLMWQMSLLTLFAKIKCSRKFPNLQYNTLVEELCSVSWGATYCRGAEAHLLPLGWGGGIEN